MQQQLRGRRIGVEQAVRHLAPGRPPFAKMFEHGTLSVEIFSPKGSDDQQPHSRDEIYVVVHGHGEFVHGETREQFKSGDFIFIPAGLTHRFENFDDDLVVWVMFYGPEGGER
jgi:mannose-6-phosphate isomerase-like protein (cupin superfamily)